MRTTLESLRHKQKSKTLLPASSEELALLHFPCVRLSARRVRLCQKVVTQTVLPTPCGIIFRQSREKRLFTKSASLPDPVPRVRGFSSEQYLL